MKTIFSYILTLLFVFALGCSTTFTSGVNQLHAGTGKSFKGPIGLQLYSLRAQFAKDVPATLDQVHSFGVTNVELAGSFNLSPVEFKKQLDARGLKPISGHLHMNGFATMSKISRMKPKYLVCNMSGVPGLRTKIRLTKKLREKRFPSSIAPVKRWPNTD